MKQPRTHRVPELTLGVPLIGNRRRFLRQLATTGLGAAGVTHANAWANGTTPDMAAGLRKLVRGHVVGKNSAAWQGWCEGMVWQQRKPSRRPPLIVQAANESDVMEAVKFARRNGLKVAVRTGGHSVWASFMRDEGLLIDLSLLTKSSFNADDRSAVVQPALWGYHLIERAAPHGLAFPVAHCAQVGLGGYLLGGGIGINHDSWGNMACFNIRGADVVTAKGELITVDAKHHSDLYWAVRGAGQGFPGIVTKLHLSMHSRPKQVLGDMYVLPLERAADAVTWIRQALGEQSLGVEVLMVLARGPSGQPVAIVMVNTFAGSLDEARSNLAPFANSALASAAVFKQETKSMSLEKLLIDSVNPMTGFGFGGYAVDTIWTAKPSEAVAVAAAQFKQAVSPTTHVVISFKSGRPLPGDAAFSRNDAVFLGLYATWDGQQDNANNISWLRSASAAIQPFASGHYINEIDAEATPEKARDCFSSMAWNRLGQVRQKYDQGGLFHGFLGLPV